MAYNRYDQRRGGWREGRSRFGDDRWDEDRQDRSEHGDRGFFERAGDEIASWFGDDDAERRRGRDNPDRERDWRSRGSSLGRSDDDRSRYQGGQSYGRGRDYDRGYRSTGRDTDRSWTSSGPRYAEGRSGGVYGGGGAFDYDRQQFGRRDFSADVGGDYRPFSGDVGRSDSWQDRYYGGYSPGFESSAEDYELERRGGGRHDPHYHEWRRRQIDALDRDYDEYRRENQSRFEDEFSSWRNTRQQARQRLGQVRQHMEVCGSDDEVIGKVDRVAGDKVILTKSDDPSGRHHSIMCNMIDRVEGNRVILNTSGDNARQQWRDESRDRALFEREDQGEAGPGMLNRSFSGTYKDRE